MKNQTTKTNAEVATVKEETAKIEVKKVCRIFIAKGASGMINNNTMIDALKLHINNKDDIKEIYEFYPTVFKSAAKYLSNKEKATLNSYIEGLNLEVQTTTTKASKTKSEEHQMLLTIMYNLDNLVAITRLKVDFPELFEKAIDYGINKLHNIKETK